MSDVSRLAEQARHELAIQLGELRGHFREIWAKPPLGDKSDRGAAPKPWPKYRPVRNHGGFTFVPPGRGHVPKTDPDFPASSSKKRSRFRELLSVLGLFFRRLFV
jgi:hypothetical protein